MGGAGGRGIMRFHAVVVVGCWSLLGCAAESGEQARTGGERGSGGGALSSLGAPDVLAYEVAHFEGSSSFVVQEDGSATHKSGKTVAAKVEASEIEAVVKVLVDNELCALRSARDTGVPDEARPTVRVRLGG